MSELYKEKHSPLGAGWQNPVGAVGGCELPEDLSPGCSQQ